MKDLSIKRSIEGHVDEVCERVTNKIKEVGFGILTRIDFDKKIEEKLGKKINKTVILGACNPALAYEAYNKNKDVTLFIPCNIVLTQTSENQTLIEAMRPTMMLNFLEGLEGWEMANSAEESLKKALSEL